MTQLWSDIYGFIRILTSKITVIFIYLRRDIHWVINNKSCAMLAEVFFYIYLSNYVKKICLNLINVTVTLL